MRERTIRRMLAVLCIAAAAFLIAALLPLFAPRAADAEMTLLPFGAENWTQESGAQVAESASLSADQTRDAGENKLLLHTKEIYSDFHLQYTFQYASSAQAEPWLGYSGVLLHGSGSGADGYYIGFYAWDGNLWCSTGYYREGVFHHLNGVDAGWVGAGLNENIVDVYVKDSHINVLINGWLFQNAPMPYTESGVISVLSDGITGTYKDFAIETLDSSFDISSKLIRANWNGSNIAGDMYYWNSAGLDHTFRMRLPDSTEGVQEYWLARRSKISDSNQTVDVYVDTGATLTLADEWTNKAATWGDAVNYCTHGNSMFGLNMVEIPVSAFESVQAGAQVGFYIDKNVVGWYSAAEYWLLYKDADGILRVADYMDMAYSFDTAAHSLEFDATEGGEKGFHFVCQANGVITSHRRGQEFAIAKTPDLYKIKDIEHTFAVEDGEMTFDASEYVRLVENHTGCKLVFVVDGGLESDALILPPATKTGTILVRCIPDGSSNDNSGAIFFEGIEVELGYSTVLEEPDAYLIKTSDPVLYSIAEGQKADLREYVRTNVDGEWSLKVGGETFSGSEYTLPRTDTQEDVVLTVQPAEGEALSVTLHVNVHAYELPQTVSLPFYESGARAPGKNWLSLYGTVSVAGNDWVAQADAPCGVLVDLGTDSYAFQAVTNAGAGNMDKSRYGFLLHADIGVHGLSGLLIGLEYKQSLGALYCSAGWLNEGKYTALSDYDAYFDVAEDYFVKFISNGSFVELFINGYRVFTVMDKYNAGGKIAILNDGNDATYSDIRAVAFHDDIADYVFRSDWSGSDTFSKMASWRQPFTVTFSLPDIAGAENFRLVRRTSFFEGTQAAQVSADENHGTWSLPDNGRDHGDSIYKLNGFMPQGDSITVTITPENTFKASYMWLIYEKDGVDYIADSVYFGHEADVAAHDVAIEMLSGSDKRFVHNSNAMLLTFAPGEQAVFAREVSVVDSMQAKSWTDKNVSASLSLPYRLYLPEGYDQSREYPMVVFLHGAGERGSDNSLQITGSVMGTELLFDRIILGEYSDDFIIVAPQCPANMRWVERDWTSGAYDFGKTEQSVVSQMVQSLIYNEILEKYSVDRSRVYGVGLSMGGFGIMDLAARNPGLFAAIVNCAGGADASVFELFDRTAVRAYHSETDTTVKNDELLAFVLAAKNAGQEAQYYEVANIGHASWQVGFEDADLLVWLLSHEKTWTVRTELNGGTLQGSIMQSFDKDTPETSLPEATKEGYRFGGWYLDAEFEQGIESIGGNLARDVVLYAKWVKDVTVQIFNGDEKLDELTVENGSVIDLSRYTLEKTGYTLSGWTDGENDYPATAKVSVSEDIAFTATWIRNNYTVEVKDGGETIGSSQIAYGEMFSFDAPAKTGYTFVGLYLDEELTQKAELPYAITANTVLYAKYEKQTFTVTLVYGEDDRQSKTVAYGEIFTLPAAEREGYTFNGWYTDAEFTQRADSFEVTQNITLYASFTQESQGGSAGCSGFVAAGTPFALCILCLAGMILQRRKDE